MLRKAQLELRFGNLVVAVGLALQEGFNKTWPAAHGGIAQWRPARMVALAECSKPILMQKMLDDKCFGLCTWVSSWDKGRYQAFDGCRVQVAEAAPGLRVEQEPIVVQVALLQEVQKLLPHHLKNDPPDLSAVRCDGELPGAWGIQVPDSVQNQVLMSRALDHEGKAITWGLPKIFFYSPQNTTYSC